MKMSYISGIVSKFELDLTGKMFAEGLSLDVGLFQLVFDGQWYCTLAGESCAQILGCSRDVFWAKLQALSVYTTADESATTVKALLQDVKSSDQTITFTAILPHGDTIIKGSLH